MISIISGSHRQNSQSRKVSDFILRTLRDDPNLSLDSQVIDLAQIPLPLWDESVWDQNPKWDSLWFPTRDQLRRSSAFVVVSPEWAGMAPAGLKNLFLFCGNHELAHKPALIVTVSSGTGGAYPVAELRMSSYKNNRICYIPDHVIIRQVESVLNSYDTVGSDGDQLIRIRLAYSLRVLKSYQQALSSVRSDNFINFKEFANGM